MKGTTFPSSLICSVLIILSFHLVAFCIALEEEAGDETPFTYEKGTKGGPENWGKINPQWQLCNNGRLQSPIDLLDGGVRVYPALGKLKKYYKPAPAAVNPRGHDIAVTWKGDAGIIIINGTVYKLMQCHWHSPSEHTFNGSRYNLELHAVHSSSDGKKAVISVTYKYGRPDPFLAKMVPYIASLGKEEKDVGIVNPRDIKLSSRKYYRYLGSLTVPPCTEGVVWTVLAKVKTVSRDQVRVLKEAAQEGFEENSRLTQNRDGRTVLFYTPRR
ncbi:hypothetical protein Nepgr_009989 [Nepenthes gracilis]|uniref:Alpha-carbonic anhydrase domain-containing protein n=1 Tax=Nepenthes gracilis TaxID=150966 RepID=A0AAD3SCG0_NEPGR|nr:hypothetical protein Nepgr_009989 [Nepenthes gracilis]